MKILIIGNGFDLAHYLPTAYAHFMGVMQAIENLPEDKDEVTFDDLFAGLEQSNTFFFGRTREIYDGDNLKFDVDKIYELKEKLQGNKWYSFFKKHMEISTWIDFEERIKNMLNSIKFFEEKFIYNKEALGYINFSIKSFKSTDDSVLFLRGGFLKDLSEFGVLVEKDTDVFTVNKMYFEEKVCRGIKVIDEVLFYKIFQDSLQYLRVFSDIFEGYLVDIVGSISLSERFKLDSIDYFFCKKEWDCVPLDRIYSFNYTSTFARFYETEILSLEKHYYFLHGQAGNPNKKIVLGVDEVDDRLLIDYGLYGFLKYHQKLMNDTDYLFLRHDHEVTYAAEGMSGELEIYVWGHSMDASDSDYVKEIFDFDENFVFVKVFYFGSAKFDLLANLFKIVGREKIERWMKKGALKFEKVPDLYELNFAKQTVEPER